MTGEPSTRHEHGAWCHPSAEGCPTDMPASGLSAVELAKLAEFDAAPQLAESAPMTPAMLALAEELEADGNLADQTADENDAAGFETSAKVEGRHARVAWHAAARIRATVAAVLAADPEPRDAVIERMARAMWSTDDWKPWADVSERGREFWRRLAAAALDASRAGTQ